MRKFLWLTVAALLIGGLGTARAGAGSDEREMEGVVLVRGHRAPVATAANLSDTPLFELPLSATALPAAAFSDRLARDIADLADYAPGVSRRSNYWGVNTPTFQLRGFNAGDATAYYKDGFRYQGRGPMSLANVEAVEILRGPVSALYGWSDPGGVVHVRVKQPSAIPVGEASVQADAWGRTAASLDVGGRLAGVADKFRLVVGHEEGGSFRDGQDARQTLLAPSVAWGMPGGRELSVAIEWLDDRRTTDYGIPAVNGAPADVPVGRIYTEAWGRQHSRSSRLNARWTQPALGGMVTAAWSWYDFRYLEYRDAEPWSVTGTTINRWYESYPERYRWITGYLDWSGEFATADFWHRVATRVEVASERRSMKHGEWDDYTSIAVDNPIYAQAWAPTAEFSVYDQAWSNRSLGVVLQDEIRKGDWTWLAGVRLGYLQQVFDFADVLPTPGGQHTRQTDSAVTPRVGANWRVLPTLALYANHSSGKMPTLPQGRAFDGSAFAPGASTQSEVGMKLQPLNGRWLAALAAFDIERRNVLTRDPDHAGYSVQTGVSRSRGVELEWQGRLAPGWRLTTQATWLDASITQDNRYAPGNRLPYAPKSSASVWLTHEFATGSASGGWRVSGGAVHQGARYADFSNATRIPGYTRMDLGANYREVGWSATWAVENVLNRRYYASGVENRPAVIYPGAPRTVSLRLAMKF